ncbi:bifunctional tRNA (5-methylaminomethyl-2-thiouridine)(34)-methyltransferase MnmD/FAD-dependent 5-carboxymethylaminomethyl-2-thiouridine(34) oxidoreductase MnmC [Idiomarina xiamenensis]|uniref:tRNA 5-methylaminomethyl-2-thiouridine biosynthesis bifunctional protein MnmC n=1 Tax=Idiomarina xiamenensis 10-D-4 TaxID=740709 RepID=K2K808_9GAMM|nr:bifunctional tRNA (5-methylaminomethyl-2-thiouridine)(34)-methyltransferase MnmD/FAD-dependent 5-carboxymethylaminomethyl-2-thiouridine(34) oxidoreductase MnmC [Idiomarina xiamenensis]EKE83843.1 fused DadA-like amino acid oxidase domain/uncharacterized domain-containing protein [Idiomarina xiamenensis 10-D-4]
MAKPASPIVDNLQAAAVHFNEQGVPVSDTFDDIYYSNDDGLAESSYVFVQHNGLIERWQNLRAEECFVIAESGFGSGLNFINAWAQFEQHAPASARLHFVSFEKYPLTVDALRQALSRFTQLAQYSQQLVAVYPLPVAGLFRCRLAQGRVTLDLIFGDLLHTLPRWQQQAKASVDAWFLDGFAPAKNPDMWQSSLYQGMAVSAKPDASFATFTAVGAVKRGLQAAGFQVEKVPGYGRKREMLRGQLSSADKPQQKASNPRTPAPVAVIGAGIAGLNTCYALQQRGIETILISTAVADGGSGNRQGAVYPQLHAEATPLSDFYHAAFHYAQHWYPQVAADHCHFDGLLQLAFNPQRERRYRAVAARCPAALAIWQTAAQLRQQTGLAIQQDGLYLAGAGWLTPAALLSSLLARFRGQHYQQTVTQLQPCGSDWRLSLANGSDIVASQVVLANAHAATELLQPLAIELPLRPVRGQVTLVRASSEATSGLADNAKVICHKGYLTPAWQGVHCVGASFVRGDTDVSIRASEDQQNIDSLREQLPDIAALEVVSSRAAVRCSTPDHLPIVGALTAAPGLFTLLGLGSHGLTAAPLCAELVAAALCGEPAPLLPQLSERLAPQRFAAKRGE